MTIEHGAWALLGAAAKRAAAWPFRVAAARAAMRTLAGMDSRELADIGLTRSDLRDASAVALDGDPTELLALRWRERRRSGARPPAPPRGGGHRSGDATRGGGSASTKVRETSAA